MSGQDEMTEARANRISIGIDTAFHFLQQALFENPLTFLSMCPPAQSYRSIEIELGR